MALTPEQRAALIAKIKAKEAQQSSASAYKERSPEEVASAKKGLEQPASRLAREIFGKSMGKDLSLVDPGYNYNPNETEADVAAKQIKDRGDASLMADIASVAPTGAATSLGRIGASSVQGALANREDPLVGLLKGGAIGAGVEGVGKGVNAYRALKGAHSAGMQEMNALKSGKEQLMSQLDDAMQGKNVDIPTSSLPMDDPAVYDYVKKFSNWNESLQEGGRMSEKASKGLITPLTPPESISMPMSKANELKRMVDAPIYRENMATPAFKANPASFKQTGDTIRRQMHQASDVSEPLTLAADRVKAAQALEDAESATRTGTGGSTSKMVSSLLNVLRGNVGTAATQGAQGAGLLGGTGVKAARYIEGARNAPNSTPVNPENLETIESLLRALTAQ